MRALAVTGILFFLASLAGAQKAEPVRIEFKPGASSASLRGQLRGRQQMEYVLRARNGQTLALRLSSTPRDSLTLKVRDPVASEIPLERAGPGQWLTPLRQTGDYDIWVVRVSGRPGASTYRLTVTVR
jgi:hypothetical protein